MNTQSKVVFTPLKRIAVDGGDVLHALKASDPEFNGFGEAYFSLIQPNFIKSWRLHKKSTLNLIVPVGAVHFVTTLDGERFEEFMLSDQADYGRLSIEPEVWMAFQGISDRQSVVLNIMDRPHNPEDVECLDLEQMAFDWND
ncbi:MAG TPA: dTDP-4-dehydrorhamnose 3,5-epimerase [Deltaproteobacteria bacterium]|nr:dTDP-4-dehydrorhamnose 3,5-epimerase [Deltaproteobacteria bacterium]